MMAESSSFGPFMELLESGYDVTKREGADEEYLLCNLLCPPSSSSMLCFGADHAQKSSDSSLSTIASSPPSISTSSEARARRGRKATAAAEAVKKTKPVDSARQVKAKSSRRKIGDQIAALQQLVSPFGKTDTATVLHEAERYIRFLHEQVQVLSSPYLEHLPTSVHDNGTGRRWNDLRSRGLCLVPISCTEHMASNSINGADLFCSPSSNP